MTSSDTVYTYTPDMTRPFCPEWGASVACDDTVDQESPWVGVCGGGHQNTFQLDSDEEE